MTFTLISMGRKPLFVPPSLLLKKWSQLQEWGSLVRMALDRSLGLLTSQPIWELCLLMKLRLCVQPCVVPSPWHALWTQWPLSSWPTASQIDFVTKETGKESTDPSMLQNRWLVCWKCRFLEFSQELLTQNFRNLHFNKLCSCFFCMCNWELSQKNQLKSQVSSVPFSTYLLSTKGTKPEAAEETEKEDPLPAQEIHIPEGRKKETKKAGDLNTMQSMIKICRI